MNDVVVFTGENGFSTILDLGCVAAWWAANTQSGVEDRLWRQHRGQISSILLKGNLLLPKLESAIEFRRVIDKRQE
jgi:hypothetical protein